MALMHKQQRFSLYESVFFRFTTGLGKQCQDERGKVQREINYSLQFASHSPQNEVLFQFHSVEQLQTGCEKRFRVCFTFSSILLCVFRK